jgi:hypothetical protein
MNVAFAAHNLRALLVIDSKLAACLLIVCCVGMYSYNAERPRTTDISDTFLRRGTLLAGDAGLPVRHPSFDCCE